MSTWRVERPSTHSDSLPRQAPLPSPQHQTQPSSHTSSKQKRKKRLPLQNTREKIQIKILKDNSEWAVRGVWVGGAPLPTAGSYAMGTTGWDQYWVGRWEPQDWWIQAECDVINSQHCIRKSLARWLQFTEIPHVQPGTLLLPLVLQCNWLGGPSCRWEDSIG